ncbi:hypothetical protein [Cellulomonas shaoxiangyii]|uniref:Peptidase S9 n=1 Tax=Cellulomonas shaoxiangyii TaxID=2566013 RepID=A0A4P7SEF6_9CELL|nr:hypothetical protein [Cellulomonas shaoxiangyii]QCB92210.1 hypothetical protein E5225_00215 [Cellulomonas shaoxiangyii]TGY82634.1 hypothetical protein E5226_13055 [Cellulomonas shaoxiangyii]
MTTPRPTLPRVLAALVTGAATTAYYATPDLIRSRTARGWAKTGLAAVVVAASIPDLRAAIAAQRERAADAQALSADADGSAAPTEPGGTGPDERAADENLTTDEATAPLRDVPLAVRVGVGAVVLAGSTVGTVAAERWIFRRGEALAAAGRPLAHTRAAVVLGLAMTALALIPDPPDHPADHPADHPDAA